MSNKWVAAVACTAIALLAISGVAVLWGVTELSSQRAALEAEWIDVRKAKGALEDASAAFANSKATIEMAVKDSETLTEELVSRRTSLDNEERRLDERQRSLDELSKALDDRALALDDLSEEILAAMKTNRAWADVANNDPAFRKFAQAHAARKAKTDTKQ